MSYDVLKQRLDAGDIIILDGGIGTELERRGAPMDPSAWCGPATLHAERLLTEIHADYIAAGAEVITANTYASSRLMLSLGGYGDQVEEINRRAVEAALRARDAVSRSTSVVVAGSLSHMVPLSEGTVMEDSGKLPNDVEIAAAYHELARILAASGCQLIILEMMYHPKRVRLALDAALSTGLPVWFGLSARKAKNGTLTSYLQTEELPFGEIAKLIPDKGIDAAGVMHSGAQLVIEALRSVQQHFNGPLIAYPDSGYFEMPHWRFVDAISPQRFEEFCREWVNSGVQILGGCCGLTADHIRAVVRARDAFRLAANSQ